MLKIYHKDGDLEYDDGVVEFLTTDFRKNSNSVVLYIGFYGDDERLPLEYYFGKSIDVLNWFKTIISANLVGLYATFMDSVKLEVLNDYHSTLNNNYENRSKD